MLVLKEFRKTGQLAPLNEANAKGTYKSMWLMLESCATQNGEAFRYLSGRENGLKMLWDSAIHDERKTIFGLRFSVASAVASLKRETRKTYLAWSVPQTKTRQWMLRQLLKRFDAVLTNDTVTLRQLIEQLGVPDNKAVFVPYGVDTDYFCPPADIPNNRVDLIVPGDAYRDEETVEFLLANTGLSILRLTNRDDIADRYRVLKQSFPGRVSIALRVPHAELPDLYGRARCCLIPITKSREAAGLTCLLESIACGVPVFCNNKKTCQDYIVNSKNGFRYSTAEELLGCLQTSQGPKLAEMSKLSRQLAVDTYSWTKLQSVWCQTIFRHRNPDKTGLPVSPYA